MRSGVCGGDCWGEGSPPGSLPRVGLRCHGPTAAPYSNPRTLLRPTELWPPMCPGACGPPPQNAARPRPSGRGTAVPWRSRGWGRAGASAEGPFPMPCPITRWPPPHPHVVCAAGTPAAAGRCGPGPSGGPRPDGGGHAAADGARTAPRRTAGADPLCPPPEDAEGPGTRRSLPFCTEPPPSVHCAFHMKCIQNCYTGGTGLPLLSSSKQPTSRPAIEHKPGKSCHLGPGVGPGGDGQRLSTHAGDACLAPGGASCVGRLTVDATKHYMRRAVYALRWCCGMAGDPGSSEGDPLHRH